MKHLLGRTVASAIGVGAAALALDGIRLGSSDDDVVVKIGTALAVGLILALLTMLVRPALRALACPLMILTLGLFDLVIAAFLLWLTSQAAGSLGLGFHVDDFLWNSVLGAVVIMLCNLVTGPFVGPGSTADDDRAVFTDRVHDQRYRRT